jgi:DNA mismatch repair protein MutS2
MTGESHALDTALRLELPSPIVERARALLDDGERSLSEALAALEAERARAESATAQSRAQEHELGARAHQLESREHALEERIKAFDASEGSRFAERLREAEKAIGAIVADLQRQPSHRRAEAARASIEALSSLTQSAPSPPETRTSFAKGDRVVVRTLGRTGEIVKATADKLHVRVGKVLLHCSHSELEPAANEAQTQPARVREPKTRSARADLGEALRIPGNTLDVRGLRVNEGFDAADRFFDQAVLRGADRVFLLHGHGGGALKTGLRAWLGKHERVSRWAPASADQGGDAFTVVLLSG